MKIQLKFTSLLTLKDIKSGDLIDVEKPTSLRKVLLNYKADLEMMRYITPIVNGERVNLDYEVNEGDMVYLIVPIGGG